MDDKFLYDSFLKIYKQILYKQYNSISDPENFLFVSDIHPLSLKKKIELKDISELLKKLEKDVNLMDKVFFKDYFNLMNSIKMIFSFFKNNEKNFLDDLLKLEKNNKYFYCFKEKNNIIEKYINDYMSIIVDIIISVSKIFYMMLINGDMNFKIIENHLNFIEILRDFTLYLFTGQNNSNNAEFKNILNSKNVDDIQKYMNEFYDSIYKISLINLKNNSKICENCLYYPKLNFYELLTFFDTNTTLKNELPSFYESISKKINYLFEEMVIYIQNILNILKSNDLSMKYLSFPNVFILSDKEYENLPKSGLIKSKFSTYIERKISDEKIKNENLIFNLSYIDLPNNLTLISYRSENNLSNEIIEPKNIKYCYNIFDNEKRINENSFMWDKWSTINTIFEIKTNFEMTKTKDFYDGSFLLSKIKNPLFDNIIGYDHRFQKLKINIKTIEFYEKFFNNMIPFEKDNEYYYVLLYDTMISQLNIYGMKNNQISLKQFLVPQDSDLYKYIDTEKNKNYSFVESFIDKELNLIFIFSEWFYKDGLKFLYVNMNDFNIFTLNTVYDKIKITGLPTNKNYPYFSFTTNTIKYNSIFIGVGHTKIKNGYENQQCNLAKSVTDFINYSTYGKNYIRHFGSSNVNQLYYSDGEYKNNLNKNSEEVSNDGVDEDWNVMNQDTKCIGFQYYMFFYIFEFIENTDKLKYFKISSSFIPRINNVHKLFKNYHYSLIFPMSIVLRDKDTVTISGGEGDVRSFLLDYNINDILNICEFDIGTIDIDQYKFYPCT